MTTATIELTVGEGTARGALAIPEGDGKHGALIVIHEWWGMNREILDQTSRFAAEGFLALAVDLYGGEVTDRADRAAELANAMSTPAAMAIVQAAARWLAEHPRSNGRVGVTGFCLGGAMALAAAANVAGLAAVVPFYGTPKKEYLRYRRMRAPIQGHYARNDPFVSPDRPPAIQERVRAAGGAMELFLYDAGHAFLRRGDPTAYHEASAKLAWSRAVAFLHEHLG